MRVSDLSPGWRTEFFVSDRGADAVEHSDCIAARTPSQPDFYWGRLLLLPQQPADEPRAIGRFQHAETNPARQRRGLCTALVDAVTAFGFGQSQLERIVWCADSDDVAFGLYEGRGYRRVGRVGALQRRATRDRLTAT